MGRRRGRPRTHRRRDRGRTEPLPERTHSAEAHVVRPGACEHRGGWAQEDGVLWCTRCGTLRFAAYGALRPPGLPEFTSRSEASRSATAPLRGFGRGAGRRRPPARTDREDPRLRPHRTRRRAGLALTAWRLATPTPS
ncbi:DUF6255 family natural product biosynthesis protein [Streptomyces mashuensis]|uniref:DUF6255 family natural product biosynthesis protein n=1 Tax=Streptomyces mashuensis TaxID=33904 RepID=UPI00357150DB